MLPSINEGGMKKEKEELKLTFEANTSNMSLFEEGDNSLVSGKHKLKLAETKAELYKIIAAL
jgi:hypothetical protein